MSTKRYNATRTKRATDGLGTWQTLAVDLKKPMTAGDRDRLSRWFNENTPTARLARLEAGLQGLKKGAADNAALPAHIEHIGALLADLQHLHDPGAKVRKADLYRLRETWQAVRAAQVVRDVVPAADKGRKFKPGRPKGAVGIVKRTVKRILEREPGLSAGEVWQRLEDELPADWQVIDAPRTGLAPYIEGPRAEDVTGWARFRNVVSEVKRGR